MENREILECRVGLTIGGRNLQVMVDVPGYPLRLIDMVPFLYNFYNRINQICLEQLSGQGADITCHSGCGACCSQLVPVSPIEAIYLAEQIEKMPVNRKTKIRKKNQSARHALKQNDLLDSVKNAQKLQTPEEKGALAETYFYNGPPCPYLENDVCSIYPYRPLICREFVVTSNPEFCKDPKGLQIKRIDLPVKLSTTLFQFGQSGIDGQYHWVPLVIALEWAEANSFAFQSHLPGPEIMDRIFKLMAYENRLSTS